MTYSVNFKNNGKMPLIIPDEQVNTATDLTLPGRNFAGYGEFMAENLIFIMEHFSNTVAPTKPIEGQIWYDSSASVLKFYTALGIWKPISSLTVSQTGPEPGNNEADGDFWLDEPTGIIYMFINNEWRPIINADGSTNTFAKTRQDTLGGMHKTLEFVVNNKTTLILCSDVGEWIPFSIGATAERLADNALMVTEFPTIRQGANLNMVAEYVFHGTATSAQYADLAERYRSDKVLEPGTVVELGGIQEISETTLELSPRVFGVISEKPAFMMNQAAGTDATHPFVALSGRVWCKVTGIVNKGDRLVTSTIPGVARAATAGEEVDYRVVIGRALMGSNNLSLVSKIEISVGVK